MKLNNWNENAIKVRTWLESLEESTSTQAIALSLMLGDNAKDDDERTQFWGAVRSIGGKMEGFPQARRGNQPQYSEETTACIALAEQMVANAYASIPTEHHHVFECLFFPHGRTGGMYSTYQDYVDAQKAKAVDNIAKAIKDGRWDEKKMTKQGLPVITPLPTKEEREAMLDGGQEEE